MRSNNRAPIYTSNVWFQASFFHLVGISAIPGCIKSGLCSDSSCYNPYTHHPIRINPKALCLEACLFHLLCIGATLCRNQPGRDLLYLQRTSDLRGLLLHRRHQTPIYTHA
jgi:hypothetical protein